MHIMFYSTNHVFEAEELLKELKIECEVVPTPVTDKAYCGVCIETSNDRALIEIEGMEYTVTD